MNTSNKATDCNIKKRRKRQNRLTYLIINHLTAF